eukprot:scaffold10.g2456.t1
MAAALFNTADLARYKQLEAQLADYRAHQVEENSSAATQQVRELEAALAREQAALHQIKGAEAAAAAEVDKQSHFHLGKLFRSEAANQKKKAAAEASLSDLQARRASEMQGVERVQVELVDALFAQPHWAAQAEVAAAAAAIADLQRKGNESSQHGATYARAEQQLQAADARLAEAEQHMGTAQFIGRVEMMDNIIDPWQRRHPMDHVAAARDVLPSLPWVNEAVLESASQGVFINLLFGGLLSDMNQMIRTAMEEIREMHGAVRQCLNWVEANRSAFQGSAEAVAAQARDGLCVLENHQAAQAQLNQLQGSLNQASVALQHARGAEGAAAARVEKLSQSGCCGALCSSEARKGAAEAELSRLEAESKAQAEQVAAWQAKLQPASELAAAWATKYAELQAAEKAQADLVNALFAQPHWQAVPEVAATTAAAAGLQRQAAESAGHAATYSRAQQLMKSAEGKLARAQQAMARAQGMGRAQAVNTIVAGPRRPDGRRRRQPASSMLNMAQIRRAEDDVRSAAQDVSAARAVLPSLPWINEATLRSASAGVFMNNAQFRAAMGQIQEMRSAVQQCLAWVASNSAAFHGSTQTVAAQVAAKEAEVRAFKQARLQEALAALAAQQPPAAPTVAAGT